MPTGSSTFQFQTADGHPRALAAPIPSGTRCQPSWRRRFSATDKLFITGHSLRAPPPRAAPGGNVVGLDRVLGVYTFGMPRSGNNLFAQDYRAIGGGALANRTFRFVDGDDIVPQVPPPEAPFDYRHVGCSLTCGHGALFDPGNLVADAPEQVAAGASAVLGLAQGLLRAPPMQGHLPAFPGDPLAAIVIDNLPPSIRDHLMDRYLRALATLWA